MSDAPSIFRELGFNVKGERLPEAVVYSLARTFSLIEQRLSTVYKQAGISTAAFNLLMLLKEGSEPDSFTQQAIGKRLAVSASNMTGLIDRLEKRGLVHRIPGKDRRSKLLRITPKGGALLSELWPKHCKAVESVTEPLRDADSVQLVKVLAALRSAQGRA